MPSIPQRRRMGGLCSTSTTPGRRQKTRTMSFITILVFLQVLVCFVQPNTAFKATSPLGCDSMGSLRRSSRLNRIHPRCHSSSSSSSRSSSRRIINSGSSISGSSSALQLKASGVEQEDPELSARQMIVAGGVSRGIAQLMVQPFNTYKTLLQLRGAENGVNIKLLSLRRLFQGVDANLLLGLPHGAMHFYVIDRVKFYLSAVVRKLDQKLNKKLNFVFDFLASALSTLICSSISTPQMLLSDRIMAGVYPNLHVALQSILIKEGICGLYTGWWPNMVQKIPSYGLTWMFFQQLKQAYEMLFKSLPDKMGNFILGALAAASSVVVMIPMDMVKTRLVTQMKEGTAAAATTALAGSGPVTGTMKPYKGVLDCLFRVLKEEGVGSLYRSLPARLMGVVPMIAIQFAVYEYMKKMFADINNNREQQQQEQEQEKLDEEEEEEVVVVEKKKEPQ